jgi:hypothetical protein
MTIYYLVWQGSLYVGISPFTIGGLTATEVKLC